MAPTRAALLTLAVLASWPAGLAAQAPTPTLPWSVVAAPTVAVGGVDDRGGLALFRVRGAARLPNGTLAVVDAGNSRVVFYDAQGMVLRTVGREGVGPEEFQAPAFSPRPPTTR